MTQNTVHVNVSRSRLHDALLSIPQEAVSGPETEALLTRIGLVSLGRIKQAFVEKARGGTDEAGDRWKPLSPKTIAYSKTRSRGAGGRTRTEKKRDAFPSQALTKKQNERWWDLYRQGLAIFKGNKASAARRAWAILKGEGATTLLQKYGGRQVEILRDTGLLLNSLSPGYKGPEQVFRIDRNSVIIGTNRKWAAAHHRGVPGKLPQRRLWPPTSKWPQTWWADITDQIKQGLLDIISQRLQGTK